MISIIRAGDRVCCYDKSCLFVKIFRTHMIKKNWMQQKRFRFLSLFLFCLFFSANWSKFLLDRQLSAEKSFESAKLTGWFTTLKLMSRNYKIFSLFTQTC